MAVRRMLRTSNLLNIKNKKYFNNVGVWGGWGRVRLVLILQGVVFLQCQNLYRSPEGFMWSLWLLPVTLDEGQCRYRGWIPSRRCGFMVVVLYRAASLCPVPWGLLLGMASETEPSQVYWDKHPNSPSDGGMRGGSGCCWRWMRYLECCPCLRSRRNMMFHPQ